MTENHQPPANTVEAVIRERLAVAVGGWRGSLEAALPTVAFVAVWTATKNLNQALIAAAVVLAVALVLRLVQRQTVKFVVAAAFATAFAAFLAKRSGNAFASPRGRSTAMHSTCCVMGNASKPRRASTS